MVVDQATSAGRGRSLRLMLLAVLIGVTSVAFWPHNSARASNHVVRHNHLLSPDSPANSTLVRRDSYSCSASKPCSNGACCGASGFCGYGSTYCGTGCLFQCDATAECGQYAKTPGQTCPLNTCCSEYGFCGTTQDFCGTGCQSNCVLSPKPSGGRSQISVLKNRVIGYYKAWMARKSCHKIDPTNLPLDALTHVNFAFASIDPSSYQVVAMDSTTPSSLFKDTTNIKSIKQDLGVFVSIGGWSFSDNNTKTQPLFGEIAGDATKRQTFANNVVHFMQQYGFDGVDIDWEYPGAGDRGGKPEDTQNYVLLLKTLRQTFDSSGSTFGLTFTAPSSYWYLRWFDLPKMVKYADWINVMTYDLHGVWDASNPIGSIVQAHTNLTEIKAALELFWRVDIPPGKLVLGFGFYGRSFTLADPSCTTPGCPFSGASDPGPCSDTAGMLAYYEIMSVLQGTSASPKRATISPTHDKEAAVNYFTFEGNQWISYDDNTTFRQKVNWANDVGLGGAMIWASDLDDDKYSAHSGLLDRSVISTATLQEINKAESNPKSVITDLAAFNGQNCFRYSGKCVNLNDNTAMANACGSGNTVVGWDDAGCGKKHCHCGKPICCPSNAAPKNCKWRGQSTGQKGASSDCSGQCEAGEMNINGIRSSWGGGFTNDGDTNKCGRGYKAFCCPDPDYKQVTRGCSYAACGKDCPKGKTALLTKFDNCWAKGQKYCCPDPAQLAGCHWVGGSGGTDCANARCNATELQVDLATMGDSSHSCEWGRSRAACCSVKKAPTRKAMCTINLCDKDSEYCGASASDFWKRSFEDGNEHSFPKRKVGKKFAKATIDGLIIKYVIAGYPTIGELFTIKGAAQVLLRAFRTRYGYCAGSTLDVTDFKSNPSKAEYAGLNTEHPLDKSLIGKWMEAAGNGVLPTSRRPPLEPIDIAFWQNVWNEANTELGKKPPVGRNQTLGKQPDKPSERIAEAFGSNYNPFPFLAVEDAVNVAKGKIFEHKDPVQLSKIPRLAKDAVKADTDEAVDELLSEFQTAFAALEYIRNGDFEIRYNDVIQQVYLQLGYIEETTGTYNLQNWWSEWTTDHASYAVTLVRRWAREAIRLARAPYIEAHNAGRNLQNHDRVMAALDEFEDLIAQIRMPTIYHLKYPNPLNGEGPSGYNS